MNVDYWLRSRHGDTLFKIDRSRLHRRLQYLDRESEGTLSSRQRPDTRPGVEAPETVYVLHESGPEGAGGVLVAVERHDEARLQGYASLRSEPAALRDACRLTLHAWLSTAPGLSLPGTAPPEAASTHAAQYNRGTSAPCSRASTIRGSLARRARPPRSGRGTAGPRRRPGGASQVPPTRTRTRTQSCGLGRRMRSARSWSRPSARVENWGHGRTACPLPHDLPGASCTPPRSTRRVPQKQDGRGSRRRRACCWRRRSGRAPRGAPQSPRRPPLRL